MSNEEKNIWLFRLFWGKLARKYQRISYLIIHKPHGFHVKNEKHWLFRVYQDYTTHLCGEFHEPHQDQATMMTHGK